MSRPVLAQKGRFWQWIASLPMALSLASAMAMANVLPDAAEGFPSSARTPGLPVFVGISLSGQGLPDWSLAAASRGVVQGTHDASAGIGVRKDAARPALVLAALGDVSITERWARFGEAFTQPPRENRRAVPAAGSEVLGSVALAVSQVPQSRRWRALLEEGADAYFADACSAPGSACAGKLRGRLAEAVAVARGQDDREAVETVNKAVNAGLRYRRDLDGYGVPDYWATVGETLARGAGDCEEFAVLKMWMLRAAGFEPSQMRLQLVKLLKTGEDHAILIVDIGASRLVLDNLSASVRDDGEVDGYRPLLSFVGEDAFLHGFKRKPARPSEIAALR